MTDPPIKPRKPQRPTVPDAGPARGSPAAAMATLVLGISAIASLVFLAGPVMLIVAAVFGLVAAQYMAWGWWLSGVIRKDDPPDDPPRSRVKP